MNLPEVVKSTIENQCHSEHVQVLLACSGGPDSMALFYSCILLKIPFAVAHVNYRLRGLESDEDEAFVKKHCSKHHIPCFVHRCLPEEINAAQADIQRTARKIRYTYFHELVQTHAFKAVLTAHHRDDDLETYLMQKSRGSGLSVYPGIRQVNTLLLRPFIGVYKSVILDWLAQEGFSFRTDSSNEAAYYQRNKLRAELLKINDAERAALFTELDAAKKNHADHAKSWEGIRSKCIREYSAFEVLSGLKSAPEKTIEYGINERTRQAGFNNQICRKIWNGFLSSSHAMCFRSGRYVAEVSKSRIILEEKASLPETQTILPESFRFAGNEFQVLPCVIPDFTKTPNRDAFSLYLSSRLFHFPLLVSQGYAGDKIRPFGMHGTKPVSHVLREAGVPMILRKHVPVLRKSTGEIIWIAGIRAAEETRALAGEEGWKISFQPSKDSLYAFLKDSKAKISS